jgi:hypothetical protein
MSGGAYPCNIDCGKRQQLEKCIAELDENTYRLMKRIEGLEALLIEYKDAECRAVKAEGEALKHIAELEERVDFYAEGVCLKQAQLIEELQECIELALRLNKADITGFIPDALRGRRFSEMPKDIREYLLECEAMEKNDARS